MTAADAASLVDLVLILVALEAAAILWWHRTPERRDDGVKLLVTLCAGAILMLTVRLALSGAAPTLILALLAAAGLAHLGDLWLRWRRRL